MSLLTPELASKLAIWRAKAAEGTITLPEMKEAIIALRMGRKSAMEAAATTKTRTSKKVPTASAVDDALGDLLG
jgi:hypothetical protein